MDYNAFTHGPILSKIWLCEELEKFIKNPVRIMVLGCWYNLIAFLLFARNHKQYKKIDGIDINLDCVNGANKINDAWKIENKLETFHADANNAFYQNYDIVICTSTEDIKDMEWYSRIPEGHLVCLQTLNLTQKQVKRFPGWEILNPTKTMEEFKTKYPMKKILYEGSKKFDYSDLKYTRFMLIGIK